MIQELINFILNIPQLVAPFFNWLISPIGGGLNFTPLGIFTIGAFVVVFIFHVVHLVNPLG